MTSAPATAKEAALHDSARGSSFHMAMLLLPKDKRKALLTLYAVCRALDDAVDDAPDAETAQARLAEWRTELEAVFSGGAPTFPLARDFQKAHRRYDFAKADMDAMLVALQLDAEGRMRRPTLAQLERYCYGVASATGLLAMRIFGCEGEHARPFAIALGHALQLTNILRDVATDAAIDRIYLPQEFQPAITPQALLADMAKCHAACTELSQKARECFLLADLHGQHLPPRAIAPALAMRDVYAQYWRKLDAAHWQPPQNGKIRLSAAEKATLARRASGYMLGKFKPVDL